MKAGMTAIDTINKNRNKTPATHNVRNSIDYGCFTDNGRDNGIRNAYLTPNKS